MWTKKKLWWIIIKKKKIINILKNTHILFLFKLTVYCQSPPIFYCAIRQSRVLRSAGQYFPIVVRFWKKRERTRCEVIWKSLLSWLNSFIVDPPCQLGPRAGSGAFTIQLNLSASREWPLDTCYSNVKGLYCE